VASLPSSALHLRRITVQRPMSGTKINEWPAGNKRMLICAAFLY
jgi:hypothetical protein